MIEHRKQLSLLDIEEQALSIVEQVKTYSSNEYSIRFSELLKKSDIPYIAWHMFGDSEKIYELSYRALYILGMHLLPQTVGYCMHQYIFATLNTVPLGDNSEAKQKRDSLAKKVLDDRLLLTVSNFGKQINAEKINAPDVIVKKQGEEFLVTGKKSFQSFSSLADLLLFSAEVEGHGLGLFYIPLHDTPGVELSPPLFDGFMGSTDTRSIVFKDVELSNDNLLAINTEDSASTLHMISRAWFQSLVTSPYLGAASRAIQEGVKFANSVNVSEHNKLSTLDGVLVEFGRLSLKLQSSLSLANDFSRVVAKTNIEKLDDYLKELLTISSVIKYTCTDNAEQIVDKVRKIIGSRSMAPGHIVGQLSQGIQFGQLHPNLSSIVEREFGRQILQ